MPVVTSPTTATPLAGRSNAVDSTIPMTSATRAPGILGTRRRRMRIPIPLAMPRVAVYRFTSSRPAPIVVSFSMIVLPPPGMPSRAGIWPTVMTTANPITKPVTTDAARNCERNPSLARPATIRMIPTMSASAALSATNRLAIPGRHGPHDRRRHDRHRRAGGDLHLTRRAEHRIGRQRREGRHQARLGRHPRKAGICHRDRDHHAPADDAGDRIEAQVAAVVSR